LVQTFGHEPGGPKQGCLESRHLGSKPRAAARLARRVSEGWASPSPRGVWGVATLCLPTGAETLTPAKGERQALPNACQSPAVNLPVVDPPPHHRPLNRGRVAPNGMGTWPGLRTNAPEGIEGAAVHLARVAVGRARTGAAARAVAKPCRTIRLASRQPLRLQRGDRVRRRGRYVEASFAVS
jgi:hypothetical protein